VAGQSVHVRFHCFVVGDGAPSCFALKSGCHTSEAFTVGCRHHTTRCGQRTATAPKRPVAYERQRGTDHAEHALRSRLS